MSTIKGIKVGTTEITASYTEGRVTKTVSKNLTVTAITFTVGNLGNVVYTGSAIKQVPLIQGKNVNGATVTLTEGTDYTISWSSSADSTSCIVPGTITVTVTGKGNYTGTKTVTYSITDAPITVSAPNQSFEYDGSSHGNAITYSGIKGNQTVTVKYGTSAGTYNLTSAPKITNVSDSKTIYYQVSAPNHQTATGSYSLEITRTNSSISFSANSSTLIYNGNKQNIGSISYTTDGTPYYYVSTSSTAPTFSTSTWTKLTASPTTIQSSAATATTYYVYLYIEQGANYNGVGVTKSNNTKAIGKATPTVTITAGSSTYPTKATASAKANVAGTYTYGASSGATTYNSGTTAIAANTSYSFSSMERSTAGTTNIYFYFTPSDTTNYNSVTGKSTTATVAKRTVTVTAPTYNSAALTYNGSAQTIASGGSCTTGGTMYYYISTSSTAPTSFSTSTWSTTAPSKTDAGTYYVWYYAHVSDTDNNTGTGINAITAISGSKAISPKPTTITWNPTTSVTKTFSTSAQTALTVEAASVSTGGNAPTYSVITNNSGYLTFNTTTRVLTLAANAPATTTGYSITLRAASTASNSNYSNAANVDKTIVVKVDKKTVTVTASTYNSATLTYNGSAQTIADGGSCSAGGTMYYYISATNSTPSFSTSTWSTTAPTKTDAGTYYVWYYAYVGDTANYTGTGINTVTAISGSKAIGKKPVTYTAKDQSKTYDGTALTAANTATLTSGSLVSGHTATFSCSGSQTTAGESTKTLSTVTIKNGSTDVSSNYNITKVNGKLTVGKATPSFDLLGNIRVSSTDETSGEIPYHETAYIEGRASVKGTIYWGESTSSMTNTASVTTPSTSAYNTSVTSNTAVGTKTIYAYFVPTDTANYNSVGSSSSYAKSASAKIVQSTDADITVTVTNALNYNGDNQTIATQNTKEGVTTFYLGYSTSPTGTVTWNTTANSTTVSVKNTGTYYIWYKITAVDSNHIIPTSNPDARFTSAGKKLDATCTISNGTLTITATGYSGTYDTKAHSVASGISTKNQANVTVTPTYTYSTSENGTYNSTMPTHTNATTGTDYWIKASLTGYNDAKKKVTVVINKAANPLTISPTSKTIYNTSGYNTFTITHSAAQGAVSYSSNATGKATVTSAGLVTYKAAGTATITVTAAGNDNYLSGSKTCEVTTEVDTVVTYGDVTGTLTPSQKKDLPAGGVTLTTTNIADTYGQYTANLSQTKTWKSGNTTQGTITYAWSGSNVTVPSLGATATTAKTARTVSFTITATGEGNKTKSATISSMNQEINYLVSISLSLDSSVAFGSSVTPTTTATFTSGATKQVSATYTDNPTGFVEIN